jgi:hypothetical protein
MTFSEFAEAWLARRDLDRRPVSCIDPYRINGSCRPAGRMRIVIWQPRAP